VETPYIGVVVVNSTSRIISMTSFDVDGFAFLFAAGEDNQTYKVIIF